MRRGQGRGGRGSRRKGEGKGDEGSRGEGEEGRGPPLSNTFRGH